MVQRGRTHDALYLNENRYNDPTELTKWMLSVCSAASTQYRSVLDVGCAAGELLYQAEIHWPGARLMGVDVVPELLEKAKHAVPTASFTEVSATSPDFVSTVGTNHDLVCMKGVHSIFEDPLPSFGHLIDACSSTEGGGKVVIVGMFNPAPVDVYVTYRGADQDVSHRESGWNIISMNTVEMALAANPLVRSIRWEAFKMPVSIARQEDPVRSWTIELPGGERALTNGLSLLQPMHALVVDTYARLTEG